jgi:predicted ester cyclase
VRNFVQDVLTNHNIEAPDKYFVQKPIRNNDLVIGIEGFKQSRLRLFQEFSDSHTTVDHNVAECDQVFAMVILALHRIIARVQGGQHIE